MDTNGRVTGFGHIGYSEDNTGKLLGFYEKVLGLDHVSAYGIDHPYVGRINGVPDCLYDVGFAKCSRDRHKLELVGFVNALKGDARFLPGICGHTHIIFTTDDIRACRERLAEKSVSFAGDITIVDYGRFAERKSFTIYDINGMHIMIVEKEDSMADGNGFLDSMAGVSYTVSDIAVCSRWFKDGLLLRTQDIDVTHSKYLDKRCGPENHPHSGIEVMMPDDSGFTVEILQAARDNEAARSLAANSLGRLHVCVLVDDMDAVYARMEKAGAKFVGPPALVEIGPNKGAKAIFTKFPNEMILELYQPKKG